MKYLPTISSRCCRLVAMGVLCVTYFSTTLSDAADSSAGPITILPNRGDSGVDLKWAPYPTNKIYYRIPQQIQIAVPKDAPPAPWMIPRNSVMFVTIGDEASRPNGTR